MNKILRLNNLKTRTATNAKSSVFVICGEAIIYLLLYNLHDCTFKDFYTRLFVNDHFPKTSMVTPTTSFYNINIPQSTKGWLYQATLGFV